MKWPWRKSPPTSPEGDAAAELVARVLMMVRSAEFRVNALHSRLTEQLARHERSAETPTRSAPEGIHATDP